MAFKSDSIYWVELEKVVPNPFQPRREFDEKKLQELGDSIRMYGVLQPLTVTRHEIQRDDGTFYTEYELIAGERRLRASKMAGVQQVPVIIREGDESEQEKLELAIIENLQREDLNAVDRALAFKQLSEQFDLSHVEVAKKVGRSREYVSNSIRLLALPENVLEALKRGDISEGHARTLLMLKDRPEELEVVFQEIMLKKLSVREVERISRKIATDKVRKKNNDVDTEILEMEKRFTDTLGTRVQIVKTDFGGRLTIDYFSVDDLESILTRMKAEQEERGEEVSETLQNQINALKEATGIDTSEEAPTPAINNVNEAPEEHQPYSSSEPFASNERPLEVADIDEEKHPDYRPEEEWGNIEGEEIDGPEDESWSEKSDSLSEKDNLKDFTETKSEETEATSESPDSDEKEEDDPDLYSINRFTV